MTPTRQGEEVNVTSIPSIRCIMVNAACAAPKSHADGKKGPSAKPGPVQQGGCGPRSRDRAGFGGTLNARSEAAQGTSL